jgi:hypothetical protein
MRKFQKKKLEKVSEKAFNKKIEKDS